jgi:hypothetical protein
MMDCGGGSFFLVGVKLGAEGSKVDSTKTMHGTSARGATPYIGLGWQVEAAGERRRPAGSKVEFEPMVLKALKEREGIRRGAGLMRNGGEEMIVLWCVEGEGEAVHDGVRCGNIERGSGGSVLEEGGDARVGQLGRKAVPG